MPSFSQDDFDSLGFTDSACGTCTGGTGKVKGSKQRGEEVPGLLRFASGKSGRQEFFHSGNDVKEVITIEHRNISVHHPDNGSVNKRVPLRDEGIEVCSL